MGPVRTVCIEVFWSAGSLGDAMAVDAGSKGEAVVVQIRISVREHNMDTEFGVSHTFDVFGYALLDWDVDKLPLGPVAIVVILRQVLAVGLNADFKPRDTFENGHRCFADNPNNRTVL
jgi:hypothetical protein